MGQEMQKYERVASKYHFFCVILQKVLHLCPTSQPINESYGSTLPRPLDVPCGMVLCALCAGSQRQEHIWCKLLVILFVYVCSVPCIYIITKHLPWVLGKKR